MPDMAEATITEHAVDDPDYAEVASRILHSTDLDVVAHAMEIWMRSFLKDFSSIETDRERRLFVLMSNAFLDNAKYVVRYGLEELISTEAAYARKLEKNDWV